MSRYLKTLVPITLVILLVAAFFIFRGEAQQPKSSSSANGSSADKPISAVAVAFAETEAVRDMPDADATSSDGLIEGEGAELNPDNVALGEFKRARMPSRNNRKSIVAFDSAIYGNVPSPNLPGAPLVSFDGMTANEGSATTGSIVAPSDQNIAVGPRDIVQTTNTGFKIFDKAGNPRGAGKAIRTLFKKLGGVCATFERGDPIVQHDRLADRWVISQFDFANANAAPFYECIAVSKTSDPTGAYYAYAFQTVTETPAGTPGVGTGQNFPDYPHLGTWPDGYYMTVNQFDRSKPTNQFNGTGVYAFDRAKMLVGNPTAAFVYFNLNLASHPEGIASVQPTDLDGFNLPAAGQPNVFAYEISDDYESPPFDKDALRLFNFHVDFATPANSTFTERPESPLLLAPYDARMPEFEVGSRAECEQPPPAVAADALNAISYHVMYRLQYRRLGANENLTAAFTVNTSGAQPTTAATYQAAPRYFQIRKTTAGGAYSVFDQATFSPDAGNGATGLNRFLPSAAIDNQGNLAVSYSTSSTTVFPSITYAARDFNAGGIPTAGLSGEQTLFAGTAVQQGTGNRWGDYQSLQVDPTDDCTFWTTNQYYNVNSTFNWRTRIGSFKFPSCVAPDQGTVAGTITSCETGAPISGALIQFNNGFSTASGPDGKFTIQLASGAVQTITNYTATVSAPGRNCTQSSTFTVGVVKDATTQLDVCLNGTANPIVDTTDPSGIVLSGGNGNGLLNPNECNFLNVRLTNTGCATAKNLQGTLTSNTPGVTIAPPGTSPYADIVIDGSGFNSVPFKVSTDATVGCTTVNFTLTTTFNGGTSVSNFSLQTACGTAPDQVVNGSLDSTDPKTTNGRLGRANPPSSCAAPKGCPGALGTGPRSYDVIPFVNGPGPSCVTVTPTSATGAPSLILAGAYLGAFNPADLCANYLADQGATLQPFSFNVPAGATFNVVVMEANAGTANTPYTISVSGLSGPAPQGSGPCATVLSTQASPSTATQGQSISDTATLATGGNATGSITFKLFGPNNATCSGTPIFTSVQLVNGDGTYVSGSFAPAAVGTYNWIASYSGDANNPGASGACGDPNETTTVTAVPTATPTPTATATAAPTATATPAPTATATPTPSATPTATATASPTPTATPASQAVNLSTRMFVQTGDQVGIGGFIITGTGTKHVIVRAIGPSLSQQGVNNPLADPVLQLQGSSIATVTNDNWRDSQEAQIQADGLPPTNDLESAIDANLAPGNYTATVSGKNGGTGVALVEVYDLDTGATAKLANLSTRAFVSTGGNIVIAGFVLGNNNGNDRVVVRGLGPSLTAAGVGNVLADPTIQLRDGNGTVLFTNNDWADNAAQAAELTADGLAPSDPKEAAIAATLPPGAYTALLSGVNNTTGNGLVEIYDLGR